MDAGTQVDDAAKVKSSMDYLVLNKKAKLEPVVAEKAKVDKEDYDDELARALEEARAVELQAREVEREVAVRRMALLHAVSRVAELRQRLRLAQRAVAHREALLVAIYDHVLAAAERNGEHEAKKNESDTEGFEQEDDANGNGEGKAKEVEADDEPSENEKTPRETAEDHPSAATRPRDEPTTPPTQGVAERPQAEGQEASASVVAQDAPAASSTNAEANDGVSDPTVEMAKQAHETEPQPPHAEAIDQTTTTTTTETRETEPCEALAPPPELLARPIGDEDGADGEASTQEPSERTGQVEAEPKAVEPTSAIAETAEEGERGGEEARSGRRRESSDETSTMVVVGEDEEEGEEEEVDEDEEGVLSPPSDDEGEEVEEEEGVGRRQESLDAEEKQKEERAKLLRGLRRDQPQHEEEEEEEEEEAEKSENEEAAVDIADQKNENDEAGGPEVTKEAANQARKNEAVTTHEETENCVVVSCTITMEAQAKESNDDRWHLSRLDDTDDVYDESEKDAAEHTNKEDEFTIDAQELLAFIVTKYSELDREEKNESEEADESEEDEGRCVSPMPLMSSRSLVAPDGPPRSLVDIVWSERSHGETKAPAERKAVSERKPPSASGLGGKRPKAKTAIKAKTTTRTKDEEEAAIRALKAQWLEEREMEEAARAEESKRARELADLYHLTPRRLSATLATRSASSVDTTTRTKKVKKKEKKATGTMIESQSSTRAQGGDELAAFEECRRDKEREREERRRARKEKKEGEEGPKSTERKKVKTKTKTKAAEYSQSMSRVTGRRAAKTNKTRPESPTRPSLATPSTYAGVPAAATAAPTTGGAASTQLQQLAAVSRSTPQLVSAADKTTTTKKKHRKKDKGKDDSEKTKAKKKVKKDRGSEETEPNEETKPKKKRKKKSLLRAGSRRVMKKMFGGDHDDHISSTS